MRPDKKGRRKGKIKKIKENENIKIRRYDIR